MRTAPNLYLQKSGVWLHQRRVPLRLVEFFGGTKLWKVSLRTRDPREARQLGAAKDVEIDRLIADADAALADGWSSWADYHAAQRKTAGPAFLVVPEVVFVAGLVAHFRARLDRFKGEAADVRSMADAMRLAGELHRPLPSSLRSEQATFGADLDGAGSDPYATAPAFTLSRMREALASNGLNLDPADPLFARHWRTFARSSRELVGSMDKALSTNARDHSALDAFLASLTSVFTGERHDTQPMAIEARPASTSSALVASSKLSVVFSDYRTKKVAQGSWTDATEMAVVEAVDLFSEFAGDRPIASYEWKDAREFQTLLFDLPPSWQQRKMFEGMRPVEVARIAREQEMEKASVTTVSKRFSFVSGFFRWAHRHYRDELPTNVFDGLSIEKGKVDPRDQRHRFSTNELKTLLTAEPYSPGGDRDSAEFWIPLVSLFSGMRVGEIVQLGKGDAIEEDGIAAFRIAAGDDDRKVKTAAGWRTIPVARTLIDMGFLDFVARARQRPGDRIFSDVKKKEGKGVATWSYHFSKDFSKRLKTLGIKHGKLSFHSFRHNFEDAALNSGVSEDMTDVIQGHKIAGMRGRYGKGYDVHSLKNAMNKIVYRGIDLSHLIGDSK